MRSLQRCWRWTLLLAVLVFSQAVPAPACAQATDKGKDQKPEVKPKEPVRYAFEMRNKPWSGSNGMLEWLADIGKLPVIVIRRVPGTFTFASPKTPDGKPKLYTLPEIIDILNESLATQQYLLLRKKDSIGLILTDEPLDKVGIPRLTLAELDERGNTELAEVVLQLKTLDPEKIAKEAKALLGPFGKVTPLPKGELLLRDQAGSLRQAVKAIKELDAKGKKQSSGNGKARNLAFVVWTDEEPAPARAQARDKDQPPVVKPKGPERFTFKMRDRPWIGEGGVLERLAEITRLPIITLHKPKGTFTYDPPPGPDGKQRRFTLPEIIDLLNEKLSKQEYLLVRKEYSITLIATDQPIYDDKARPHYSTLEELEALGKTELAAHILQLKTLDAEQFAHTARKMLGRFGNVVTLPKSNKLFLRDQAGSLLQAVKAISELDAKGGKPSTKADNPPNKEPVTPPGPPLLQRIEVPAGNAEALAQAASLGPFKASATLRVIALDATTLLVYASPEEQVKIAKFISGYRPGAKNLEKKVQPVGPTKSGLAVPPPSFDTRLEGPGYHRRVCINLQR